MNDALYSVLQRITTPTLARDNQLPQTRGQCRQRLESTPITRSTPSAAEIYPKQEANAANGEELLQDWRVPVDSKRGGNPSFNTPYGGKLPIKGLKPPAAGIYPKTGERQSNRGKTATLPRTGNNYPIDRRQARYTLQLSHAAICVNGN